VSVIFSIGIFLNIYVGRVLIPYYYAERVVLSDFVLEKIPYIEFGKYIADGVIVVLVITFFILLFKYRFKDFLKYYLVYAVMLVLRGVTIILNPVAHSWSGYDSRLDALLRNPVSDVNGFFFSGHTATMFLLSIFIGNIDKRLYYPSLVLSVVGIVFILLSRSHYSIDIYGGIVTAYLIAYVVKILPFKHKK